MDVRTPCFLSALLALAATASLFLNWVDPGEGAVLARAREMPQFASYQGIPHMRGWKTDLGPFLLGAGAAATLAAILATGMGARGKGGLARTASAAAFVLALAHAIVAGTFLLRGPGLPMTSVFRVSTVPFFEWPAYLSPVLSAASAALSAFVVARSAPAPVQHP